MSDLPKRLPHHLVAFLDGQKFEKTEESKDVEMETKAAESKDVATKVVIKAESKDVDIKAEDAETKAVIETKSATEAENKAIMNLQYTDKRRLIDLDAHAKLHKVPPNALNGLKWIFSRRSVAHMDRILRTIVIA